MGSGAPWAQLATEMAAVAAAAPGTTQVAAVAAVAAEARDRGAAKAIGQERVTP